MELLPIMAAMCFIIGFFFLFLAFRCKSPENMCAATVVLTKMHKMGRNRKQISRFRYGGFISGYRYHYTYSFHVGNKTYHINGDASTQHTHPFKNVAIIYPKGFPRLALLYENNTDYVHLYQLLSYPALSLGAFLLLIFFSYQ